MAFKIVQQTVIEPQEAVVISHLFKNKTILKQIYERALMRLKII